MGESLDIKTGMGTQMLHQEAPLVIRLLGAFDIRVGGLNVVGMCNRKLPSLLALLVLHDGHQRQRSLFAHTIWPESTQDEALSNLRVNLVSLRKALGNEKWRLADPRGFLALNLKDADIDVTAFDRAILRRTTASLEEAIEIYRGAFLAGSNDAWVRRYREEREQAYLKALMVLAETAIDEGEQDLAVSRLRMAASVSPYFQIAHRQLMSLLARMGRYAEADEVYRGLHKKLGKECGSLPETATTELYNSLRAALRPPAKATSPQPTLSNESPYSIPMPLTEMIGRGKEINRIVSRLDASRLVTITGIGGIGKTRTAIHVALAQRQMFQDGVVFSGLETVTDAGLIYERLAADLHLRNNHGRSWKEIVLGHLRHRQFLLILDNCEQIIDGCRDVVRTLLNECGRLKVIATSRETLGLAGEQVCRLPPFSVPDHVRTSNVEDILLNPAVQLFVERAAAAGETLELTPENIQIVVRICRRLEGIPLAIELAASRLDTLTLSNLDTGLRELFKLLVDEERAVPLRQRGLRNLLDWSYCLLDEEEQELLRNVSIFVGGWSLQAAHAVCGGNCPLISDTERTMNRLVRRSLVTVERLETGPRFRLLSIVHQYAHELLEAAPDNRALDRRYYHYYLSQAEEIARNHPGSNDQHDMNALELEYDNYRAALNWSLENEKASSNGIRLSLALWRFWYNKGYLNEGVQWFEKAIANSAGSSDSMFATALLRCGNLAYLSGQAEIANRRFQQADDLFGKIGEIGSAQKARASRGLLAIDAGDFELAENLFSQSLAYFEEVNDIPPQALILANLAVVAKGKNDLDTAIALHQRSLNLFRLSNDLGNLVLGLNNLADTLINQGNTLQALKTLCESFELCKQLGNQTELLHCVVNCCGLAQKHGMSKLASEIFGVCESTIQSLPESPPPRALADLDEQSVTLRKEIGSLEFYRLKELGRHLSIDDIMAQLESHME